MRIPTKIIINPSKADSMKLDDSDYENIFLRVREKLLIQLFAIFAVLFAALGLSSAWIAKEKIRNAIGIAVNKYIQSDDFRANVIAAYQDKLVKLEERTDQISKTITQQEIKAARLNEVPVVINDHGLSITNKEGSEFHVEMGVVNSGEKISFNNKYKKIPVVVMSIDAAATDAISIQQMRARPAYAVKATIDGFEIPPSLSKVSYRWVALGE